MEITTKTTTVEENPRRQAAVNALAIVGFIVLILIGIALAIWAARYIPVALNRLNLGAVSLSEVFTPAEEESDYGIEVAEPGTSIPFEPVSTTTPTTTPTYVTPGSGSSGSGGTSTGGTGVTYGPPRTITVPVTVPAPAPYGRADLTIDITAVGYCRTNDPDSFRRADEVPDNENGGFQFTIRNTGTNNSGRFDFSYALPTTPSLERTVSNVRSLAPNDRIDYTLCFTEPRSGDNRTITVRVDTGRDVNESNENNNTDTARIDIDS